MILASATVRRYLDRLRSAKNLSPSRALRLGCRSTDRPATLHLRMQALLDGVDLILFAVSLFAGGESLLIVVRRSTAGSKLCRSKDRST